MAQNAAAQISAISERGDGEPLRAPTAQDRRCDRGRRMDVARMMVMMVVVVVRGSGMADVII